MIKRALNYFNLFPPVTAIKFIVFGFLKKSLNPKSIVTYSQFGEDQYIQTLLHKIPNGFYLDVGCNHPIRFSNTFNLYCSGWKGICVDANPHIIKEFQSLRKKDIAVCAAVSDEEKDVDFFESTLDLASTLDRSFVENEWADKDYQLKKTHKMRTITLDSILSSQRDRQSSPVHKIDLLCIDVEGHDLNVLKSINLKQYKPHLIVIEMHGFNKDRPEDSEIYKYMKEQDYNLAGYHIINGFFTSNELEKLNTSDC